VTEARPFRVLGVQHVSLPIDPGGQDLARSFYVDLLGLPEKPVPETLPRHLVWVDAGSQEIHLLVEDGSSGLNPKSRRHPCLEVDDADALRASLDANGVETEDEDFPLPGRRRFFARDPFGNLIEFVTFERRA
jgi:catechol 2,3-dioxygenase-like lactoylglutathione lyase family enzyme